MSYVNRADLGGEPGHARVVPDRDGEPFHASWEPRAFALTLAMGATGAWNLDMSRAARETLPSYRTLGYYELWIAGLQKLLIERGLVSAEEIAQGRAIGPAAELPRVLRAADVTAALARGAPTERQVDAAPRFAVGRQVRTRSGPASHHTRLPGYARGKHGVVEAVRGAHVFPDTHAQGLGEQPRWLYTVAFDGRELWGEGASTTALRVSIDAWEPYLEPA
jgi:nitrile hydratase